MREIKFRAWNKRSREWVTPDMLGDPDRMTVRCVDDGFRFLNEDESDFIFCQYTGLKDKNGKEIYEGDIVKCNRSGFVSGNITDAIGVIQWSDNHYDPGFGIKMQQDTEETVTDGCYRFNFFFDSGIEVIGNIYDE